MIGASHIVAIRHTRAPADEYRAGIAHAIERRRFVLRAQHEREMLGSKRVRERDRLVERGGHDDRAACRERCTDDLRSPCLVEQPGEFGLHRGRELRCGGDEHHRRERIVLRLRQQLSCDDQRVRRFVREYEQFAGPRRRIDRDAARQLHLGLGHVGIPGTNDPIHHRYALGTVCHRRDRAGAAEREDAIDVSE